MNANPKQIDNKVNILSGQKIYSADFLAETTVLSSRFPNFERKRTILIILIIFILQFE